MQWVTVNEDGAKDIRYRIVAEIFSLTVAIVFFVPTLVGVIANLYAESLNTFLDWMDTAVMYTIGKISAFLGVKGIKFHD